MDKERYNKVAKITGILVGIILVLGISYAVFRTTSLGEQNNTISAGKLDVKIENEQNEINLDKTFPMPEEQALKENPYTFEVVNKGTIEAEYDLYLEVDENISTLPASTIRYHLTVEEDGIEKIITPTGRLLSKEEKIEKDGKSLYPIDIKYINPEKINKYKLYLWIDEEATTEEAVNKTFEAKVRVEAEQIYKENKLVKVVDISNEGNGSVSASFYANGVIIVRGEGTIQSGLSDTLKFENEALVSNVKKVLTFMGYDVSNLNTMEELENYMNEIAPNDPDFDTNLDNALQVVVIKEVLEEMGHDSSRVTDIETALAYVIELGYCDAEGNPTEQGEAFFTRFEEKANNDFSGDKIPPKKIILEDGITNIPQGLFTGNEAITDVIIPASVTSIDDNAFSGCRNLAEINIPKTVQTIGNNAFSNCMGLVSIKMPDSVKTMGNYVFSNCNKLVSATIGKGLTTIPTGTFSSCRNLVSVKIPNSVTSIENMAFYYCRSLKTMNFPDSIQKIGDSAFSTCGFEKIVFPKNLTTIGDLAFYSCSDLNEIVLSDSLLSIGGRCFALSNLTKVTIPNFVTTIGYEAFYGCPLLEVTVPDSVTTAGSNVFKDCSAITKVSLGAHVPITFSSSSNIKELTIMGEGEMKTYSFAGTSSNPYLTTPWWNSTTSIEKVTIEEGITKISDLAFVGFQNLTSLQLPNSLKMIGNMSFNNCPNLETVIIPDGVTTIDANAFNNCVGITTLAIPNSVTTIGSQAFTGCENVIKLSIGINPSLVTRLSSPFYSMNKIQELTITGTGDMSDYNEENYNSNKTWRAWKNSLTSIKKVTVSEGITKIGNYAFKGLTNLIELSIPKTVTSLGFESFYGCSSLTSFTISENITTLDTGVFGNCKGLTEIIVPNTVVNMGGRMFGGCTNLTSVKLPDHLTTLPSSTFSSCSSLKTVKIPNSVTRIESFVFMNSGLTNITIPESVTFIGSEAFWDCNDLKTITIPNAVSETGTKIFEGWTSAQTVNIDNTEEFVNTHWYSSWNEGSSAQINYLRS